MEFNPNINDLFGSWKILDSIPKILTKASTKHYLCICTKCNNTQRYVSGVDLKSGNSKHCNSCGQYNGYKNLSGSYLASIKKGAKSRNIEYNVTPEYLYNLIEKQNFKCKLSGVDIELDKYFHKKDNFHSASLDRIYNNLGYVEGNVQWVHKDINIMKNKYDEKYFIEMCRKIAQNC